MKFIDWIEEKNIYYKMIYISYGIISVTFLKEIPHLTTIFSLFMVLLSFVYFCLFIKEGYYFNISKLRYLLGFLLILQLSSFVVSTNYILDFIKLVFNFIFFFIISITVSKNKNDINKIFKFLVGIISPIVIISLLTYYFRISFTINNNLYGRIEEYDTSTKTLLGVTVNINTLGILCVFLIIAAFHLIASEKLNTTKKVYLYSMIFVGGVTLIHTQARGAFVFLASYAFIMIILSVKKRINKIVVVLLGIVIPLLLLVKLIPNMDIEKFSTGRTLLWKVAIDVIKNNPLFGVGTTAYVDVVKGTSNLVLNGIEAGGLHNIYIQIATANGIIALITFVIFILLSLLKFIRNINLVDSPKNYVVNKSLFSLIVSILILNLFESSLMYIMSFIAMIFWVCYGELIKNLDFERG